MRFYLTSSEDNIENLQVIADYLVTRGWRNTGDWSKNGKLNCSEISECGLFILLLPYGTNSLVEFGAALSMNKPVMILTPDQKLLNGISFVKNSTSECLIDKDSFVLACLAYKKGRKYKTKTGEKICSNIT